MCCDWTLTSALLCHICCREAALTAEVRLLREELASAQEAAAAAAGHAKQYQALATSSDEALRSMQVLLIWTYQASLMATIAWSLKTMRPRCHMTPLGSEQWLHTRITTVRAQPYMMQRICPAPIEVPSARRD